jgi:methylmalonyl-CoA mutase N-terminal domain/subunit
VIDPLGGSYYIESLTDEMERKILGVMEQVEAAGGMYAAVEQGLVQKMIGASARDFQEKVESGEQTVVGVNAYQVEEGRGDRQALPTPDPAKMQAHIAAFKAYKEGRSQAAVRQALDGVASAAGDPEQNIFERVVEAAEAGCTHGEICATLRRELGFGQPLVVV